MHYSLGCKHTFSEAKVEYRIFADVRRLRITRPRVIDVLSGSRVTCFAANEPQDCDISFSKFVEESIIEQGKGSRAELDLEIFYRGEGFKKKRRRPVRVYC